MVINKEMFRTEVMDHVVRYKTTYIDAMLHVMKNYGFEPEDAPKLVDNAIKSMLEAEGVDLNMLKSDHSNESRLVGKK